MIDHWVDQCKQGEVSAYAHVVRALQQRVVGFLYRMVQNQHTAEELGQDVFLKAFLQLQRFDSQKASFTTWVFAIARNTCIDHLRKKRPEYVDVDEISALPDHRSESPRHSLQEREVEGWITEAIEQLDPKYREVFVLKEYEHMSIAEIATVVGCEVGTVKSRLHRARQFLQNELSPLLSVS